MDSSATDITVTDASGSYRFKDTLNDDHHVQCTHFASGVRFWAYPQNDERFTSFQTTLTWGAAADGDVLTLSTEVQVDVLAPNNTGTAIALTDGSVLLKRVDGGPDTFILLDVDANNSDAQLVLSGTIECTRHAIEGGVDSTEADPDPASSDDDDD